MGPKEDKAKRGLMIRAKYLILGIVYFRAKGEPRHSFGREAILGCFPPFIQGSIWLKEEEKKFRFGILIFVSMELWYGTYMYGNYHKPYLFMGC